MAELSFDDQWLQSSERHSAPLEDISKVPVVDPSTASETTVLMSLPGVEFDKDPSVYPTSAKPLKFVQFHLSSIIGLYNATNTAKQNAETATRDAQTATAAAQAAAVEADLVDATLEGMTVTITGRDGVAKSTDIGFDIYRVYGSVAAMNADATNVPEGKFVMIATEDPTSLENARLYGKNGDGGFTFLSDLDQASSSAWADWMENYKPVIIQDHNTAVSDHQTATTDHSVASTDHQTATSDHSISAQQQATFETNEAARQQTFDTNEQTRQNTFDTDEALRQQDFEDAEAERMQRMVATECFVDTDTMCLMFIQPTADTTEYKVLDGDLVIKITYED